MNNFVQVNNAVNNVNGRRNPYANTKLRNPNFQTNIQLNQDVNRVDNGNNINSIGANKGSGWNNNNWGNGNNQNFQTNIQLNQDVNKVQNGDNMNTIAARSMRR